MPLIKIFIRLEAIFKRVHFCSLDDDQVLQPNIQLCLRVDLKVLNFRPFKENTTSRRASSSWSPEFITIW